jgi:hypothetical protein
MKNEFEHIRELAFEATRFPSHKITHVLGSRPAPTGLGSFFFSQRRVSKPDSPKVSLRLSQSLGENNGCEAEKLTRPKSNTVNGSNEHSFNMHSSAEKSLPLNDSHIQLCETELGIPHINGSLSGRYYEVKGW